MPPMRPMVRNVGPGSVWLLVAVRCVVGEPHARTGKAALSDLEEFQQAASLGTDEGALLQGRYRDLAQVADRGAKRAEGALDLIHDRRSKTASPQANDVQADNGVALRRQEKRRDVERDACAAADHGA